LIRHRPGHYGVSPLLRPVRFDSDVCDSTPTPLPRPALRGAGPVFCSNPDGPRFLTYGGGTGPSSPAFSRSGRTARVEACCSSSCPTVRGLSRFYEEASGGCCSQEGAGAPLFRRSNTFGRAGWPFPRAAGDDFVVLPPRRARTKSELIQATSACGGSSIWPRLGCNQKSVFRRRASASAAELGGARQDSIRSRG